MYATLSMSRRWRSARSPTILVVDRAPRHAAQVVLDVVDRPLEAVERDVALLARRAAGR